MLNLRKNKSQKNDSEAQSLIYHKLLPIFFIIMGIVLVLLIFSAAMGVSDGLRLGSFFFEAFHLASFYIPLYFITVGLLVYYNEMTYRMLHLLNCSFIPFLTLALALKTAFSPHPSYLEEFLLGLFPEPGATVIMLALFALELVILARFWILAGPGNETDNDDLIDTRSERPSAGYIAKTAEVDEIEAPPINDEDVRDQLRHYLDEMDERVHNAEQAPQAVAPQAEPQRVEVVVVQQPAPAAPEVAQAVQAAPIQEAPVVAPIPPVPQPDPVKVEQAVVQHYQEVKSQIQEESAGISTEQQPSEKILHQALLGDDDDLPPHLTHRPLLTDEEQAALSEVADLIAENSEEEEKMASILEKANRELDYVLAGEEHRQPFAHTTPAYEQEEPDYEDYNRVPPLPTSRKSMLSPPSDDYRYSGRTDNPEDAIEQRGDYEYETENHLHRKPFTSLFNDLVEADGVRAHADAHASGLFQSHYKDLKNYFVPESLLAEYKTSTYWEIDEETNRAAGTLEDTLREFNIQAQVTGIKKGPVITMFELLPAAGVKLSRIEALADNIAFRLAASRVRIVAPIPDKQAVGIEVPNKERSLVSFKEMVAKEALHDPNDYLPIVLGKDIGGNPQVVDLTKMPHLLIAGSTGSGKSVCVNGIISSFLFSRSPSDVRMILIDPKVVELKPYNDIPHLLTPVITEPLKALQAMHWTVGEMERRYSLLDSLGVRNIRSYNKKVAELNLATEKLPYLVVIIDEFADLMATCGKELEGLIARLAAKSRAAGIHLIIATQRPSVDVITGLIKANFPSRIAFMVASKTDSRIILDAGGAEQLLGKGDMLFVSSWHPFPVRIQGAYLSEEEVEHVTSYVKSLAKPYYIDDEIFQNDEGPYADLDEDLGDDSLFDKAVEIVLESNKATASYLQRRLKIGYNRAARLIDIMERRGIVGPANGSKPRDILQSHG